MQPKASTGVGSELGYINATDTVARSKGTGGISPWPEGTSRNCPCLWRDCYCFSMVNRKRR